MPTPRHVQTGHSRTPTVDVSWAAPTSPGRTMVLRQVTLTSRVDTILQRPGAFHRSRPDARRALRSSGSATSAIDDVRVIVRVTAPSGWVHPFFCTPSGQCDHHRFGCCFCCQDPLAPESLPLPMSLRPPAHRAKVFRLPGTVRHMQVLNAHRLSPLNHLSLVAFFLSFISNRFLKQNLP